MKLTKLLFSVGLLTTLTAVAPGVNDIITKDEDNIIVRFGENGEVLKINDPDDPTKSKLQSITIENEVISLFASKRVKEKEELRYEVFPTTASGEALTFTSSNPNVATVNNKGLVTSVDKGVTDITISNADGSVTAVAHVIVTEQNLTEEDTLARVNSVKEKQNQITNVDKVYISEKYSNKRTSSDGKVVTTSSFTENFWISKEDSYFRITSSDSNTKCEGGAVEKSRADYIFYTDEFFYTKIFKTDGNIKNVLTIDQSSKTIDPNYTRFDALCEVIGNFFTSGSSIITRQLDMIKGEDILDQIIADPSEKKGISNEKIGFLPANIDDSQLTYSYTEINGGRVGQDDASSLDIPVNTTITVEDNMKYVWENNLTIGKTINETISFEVKNIQYKDSTIVDYAIQSEDVEFLYPDESQYSIAHDIFEL